MFFNCHDQKHRIKNIKYRLKEQFFLITVAKEKESGLLHKRSYNIMKQKTTHDFSFNL